MASVTVTTGYLTSRYTFDTSEESAEFAEYVKDSAVLFGFVPLVEVGGA